jgi:hypothetical protein
MESGSGENINANCLVLMASSRLINSKQVLLFTFTRAFKVVGTGGGGVAQGPTPNAELREEGF